MITLASVKFKSPPIYQRCIGVFIIFFGSAKNKCNTYSRGHLVAKKFLIVFTFLNRRRSRRRKKSVILANFKEISAFLVRIIREEDA